jgi:hypothetical protein
MITKSKRLCSAALATILDEGARQACDFVPRKEREAFARRPQIPLRQKTAVRDDNLRLC